MRERFGRAMYELNMPQFCCGGLNFGYFYDRSPIIAYDGETAPPYTMYDFTPSTVPGCRMPHVWLRDGRSLYDAMGAGFTLLRFDRSVSVDALVARGNRAPRAACGAGRGLRRSRVALSRTSLCCRVPISTWPGAAMRSRTMRWR